MSLMKDKVCVVTGGAGSVGAACVRRFLAEGAKVMIVDRDEAALKRLAQELNSSSVLTHTGDVTDAGDVRAHLDATVAKWGPIDVIVSNAGNPGHIAAIIDYSEEAFDRTMTIHARGAFLACKYGLPKMRDGGSIVITSSVAGVRGGAGLNIAYAAAKHAQIGIMKAASRAAAPRSIRVNTVNPGPVDNAFQTGIEDGMSRLTGANVTEQLNQAIPLKRHARPDEIASVILYLASDLSTYVTGTVQLVDGGLMS
jgi:NAD(P)-dependent dehydrogenase (short-subunit alcohol dehydrogenase family)